jgi:cytochrome c oxidase subunit IV
MSSESREIMHDIEAHPIHGLGVYLRIGVILFFLTVGEVLAYVWEDSLGAWAPPIIIVLSAAKFIYVVSFYMHLKYDHKLFTGIFLFPMALAALVIVSLVLLYGILHPLRIG